MDLALPVHVEKEVKSRGDEGAHESWEADGTQHDTLPRSLVTGTIYIFGDVFTCISFNVHEYGSILVSSRYIRGFFPVIDALARCEMQSISFIRSCSVFHGMPRLGAKGHQMEGPARTPTKPQHQTVITMI